MRIILVTSGTRSDIRYYSNPTESKVSQTLNTIGYLLRPVPDPKPIFRIDSGLVFGYSYLCTCLRNSYLKNNLSYQREIESTFQGNQPL